MPTPRDCSLVSINSAGQQGNGYSGSFSSAPVISADGRYVAFTSSASNFVEGGTITGTNIFIHDRETGTTRPVSINYNGEQANGISDQPAISSDGLYVAYSSGASDLVASDSNGHSDVFVTSTQDFLLL